MHSNHGQRLLSMALPVTFAQDFGPRLDFDKAPFERRQHDLAPKKVTGEGLKMPAAKATARQECSITGLRIRHALILNGVALQFRLGGSQNANF
ncbi:MAG: hypothetical protein ACRD2S_09940 [Terriglobales bacterium]